MIEFLQARGSVDLGNMTVGIATIFIGLISLFVAFHSHQRERNRMVVEVRGRWIEEMRGAIADYVRCATEVSLLPAGTPGGDRSPVRADLIGELRRRETYIALKFEPGDGRGGEKLLEIMQQIESCLLDRGAETGRDLTLKTLVGRLITESQQVLKNEWKWALREMEHGPTSLKNVDVKGT